MSNQTSFNAWRAAVLNLCILSICVAASASSHTVPMCVLKCKGLHEFLPGYSQTAACVVPLTHIHTHSPLFTVHDTNRKEGGNKEPTSCTYSQCSAQWNRKCLATVREATECEGKIKWSLHSYKLLFSFLVPPLRSVIFHYSICQGSNWVCLFYLYALC